MRKTIFLFLLAIASTLQAQDIIYNRQDSAFIAHTLQKYHTCDKQGGKLLLAIASEFTGNRYVAGTLEKESNEPLIINTQEVDCTTFVEQALAIYATIKEGKRSFAAVCTNLQRIRYRGGTRNGYASRLHYISQWIADSAKQGLIKEINYGPIAGEQQMSLHYMSSHPASYKQLHEDSALVKEIEKWERPLRGVTVKLIHKKELNRTTDELPIKDGDVIALTTNIDGLDVTHVGFAFWKNGKLHLLHASSASEMVIKDEKTLYEYQRNRKSQTGIRVFRVE